ncbi:MAG: GNAT family N-acetyltransferase [Boseongicola sp.]|nr:MAG: GNAT family N-acetyltransferase [Boseongicola sp.]
MTVQFRQGRREDVPAAVAMLRDDALGAGREISDLEPYLTAFDAMVETTGNMLIVGELAGDVVAIYQLTLIDGLSLRAARRAQIEGVRVAANLRGQGIGGLLMQDAEQRARAGGANLLQFTSNSTRTEAHAFYARHGYEASHTGFKKML